VTVDRAASWNEQFSQSEPKRLNQTNLLAASSRLKLLAVFKKNCFRYKNGPIVKISGHTNQMLTVEQIRTNPLITESKTYTF
jgi:hypothetical protein